MKLRCAVYARFSSDKQSAASITDQVRKCREYAQARGWEILADHIYSDQAISGATSERAGLKRLMAAANAKSFDIVLFDDTSRLSLKIVGLYQSLRPPTLRWRKNCVRLARN